MNRMMQQYSTQRKRLDSQELVEAFLLILISALERKLRNELSISEDTFLIGHVGRYDPQKDVGNLIEALALLHKRQFKFSAVRRPWSC